MAIDFKVFILVLLLNLCTSTIQESTESRNLGVAHPYGLTWGYGGFVPDYPELFRVGCGGTPVIPVIPPFNTADGSCNPYKGDTPCTTSLPILCYANGKYNRPCYPIDCTSHAMPAEFYCGWNGGVLVLSDPVVGTTLTSRTVADNICSDQFGGAFRMAAHSDGNYVLGMDDANFCDSTWPTGAISGGGWGYSGYGLKGPVWTRFWVAINDQPGNCWNS